MAVAGDFRLPHFGGSLDEPWTSDATCLTIGTPPLAHAALVRVALERGWHCLCEKPFALPSGLAAEFVSEARRSGLVLGVVHNFVFSRSGTRLFDLVESDPEIEAAYAFQLSIHGGGFRPGINARRALPRRGSAPALPHAPRAPETQARSVDARPRARGTRSGVTFEHESIWASLSMSFNASVSSGSSLLSGAEPWPALDLFRDLLVVTPNDGSHRAREVLRTSAAMVGGILPVSPPRDASFAANFSGTTKSFTARGRHQGAAHRLRWISAETATRWSSAARTSFAVRVDPTVPSA